MPSAIANMDHSEPLIDRLKAVEVAIREGSQSEVASVMHHVSQVIHDAIAALEAPPAPKKSSSAAPKAAS